MCWLFEMFSLNPFFLFDVFFPHWVVPHPSWWLYCFYRLLKQVLQHQHQPQQQFLILLHQHQDRESSLSLGFCWMNDFIKCNYCSIIYLYFTKQACICSCPSHTSYCYVCILFSHTCLFFLSCVCWFLYMYVCMNVCI